MPGLCFMMFERRLLHSGEVLAALELECAHLDDGKLFSCHNRIRLGVLYL